MLFTVIIGITDYALSRLARDNRLKDNFSIGNELSYEFRLGIELALYLIQIIILIYIWRSLRHYFGLKVHQKVLIPITIFFSGLIMFGLALLMSFTDIILGISAEFSGGGFYFPFGYTLGFFALMFLVGLFSLIFRGFVVLMLSSKNNKTANGPRP